MININSGSGRSLPERVISGYPISISTSLALESVFEPRLQPYDSDRVIPNQVNITEYQEFYFNVFTLFRNLSASVDKAVFINASEQDLADTLYQELEVINSLFTVEGHGICRPLYYHMSYIDLYAGRIAKTVKLRQDTTDYQKIFKTKFVKTLKILKSYMDILEYNSYIDPINKTKSLVMTHLPFDLLSYKNFNKLDLLESNTGKLKSRNLWHTKYYAVGDRHLNNLPFNQKLLFIFGDKYQIHPLDIKLRRLILDIADNRNWTPMTTLDKIMLDLSLDIKEQFVLQFVRNL